MLRNFKQFVNKANQREHEYHFLRAPFHAVKCLYSSQLLIAILVHNILAYHNTGCQEFTAFPSYMKNVYSISHFLAIPFDITTFFLF